ncbi:hypothetical protein C8R43DRAFT_943281 [Mycena crocata]|nr:hypothetical protein C8R43DRAFT_943281 [Mycena crocata]
MTIYMLDRVLKSFGAVFNLNAKLKEPPGPAAHAGCEVAILLRALGWPTPQSFVYVYLEWTAFLPVIPYACRCQKKFGTDDELYQTRKFTGGEDIVCRLCQLMRVGNWNGGHGGEVSEEFGGPVGCIFWNSTPYPVAQIAALWRGHAQRNIRVLSAARTVSCIGRLSGPPASGKDATIHTELEASIRVAPQLWGDISVGLNPVRDAVGEKDVHRCISIERASSEVRRFRKQSIAAGITEVPSVDVGRRIDFK